MCEVWNITRKMQTFARSLENSDRNADLPYFTLSPTHPITGED
jgi:hypothetical protein